MKKLKALGLRFGGMLSALALMVGVASAEATLCLIIFHQPKVPQGMGKFVRRVE